jgi:hypothetical protein
MVERNYLWSDFAGHAEWETDTDTNYGVVAERVRDLDTHNRVPAHTVCCEGDSLFTQDFMFQNKKDSPAESAIGSRASFELHWTA